ncbi:mechanosensitive ion channel family protein [Leeuwenhoekiella polynyae]|uniref:Mechanosensitive ion channel-like protein n=1 Tax=Leeuwenhoekiella polynyae TaxID=1550906 RepID=A0A4Q0PEF5_9FLAO|nr:mechanosensitive ion channel domain-containing protein [Leeuwenhoekiella polynyae]RXG25151.1 mechanosensitive ion channel-like protein [Leeuwenhoekiella polynyae]
MIQDEVKETVKESAEKVKDVLEENIWGTIQDFLELGIHFKTGNTPIDFTVGHLLLVVLSFIVATAVLRLIRSLITRKMNLENELKFKSIFKFIRYIVYVIVVVITLSASGIDVTVLLTASAALFVGLGLALQDLFTDIIGGIFIMIDKSLSVGDVVEIDGKVGRIFEIKLRTTRALTRDDKVIIVPNHHFISDIVYNYTQNHRTTRETVKVGVAYGSDTNLVRKILLECAGQQNGVLKTPKPTVLFEDFGDSALMFGVYFFINDSFSDPRIKSEIRFRIDQEFRKNNITIPFPQRDVHFYRTNSSDS